jgi:hypothetical protein
MVTKVLGEDKKLVFGEVLDTGDLSPYKAVYKV